MPDPPQPLPSGFFAFSDDVPPDINRGFIVPRRADARSPSSFDVPDLRQRFEETRCGLSAPFEPCKQPLDYVGVTLSFGELLGSPPPLASIDAALARLPLQLVLLILAMVSAKAERGYRERRLQDELARTILPPWAYPKARGLLADPKRALLAPETPLRLALRALVNCPDKDWGDEDLLPAVFTVGQLLLALADNEPPMGDEESVVLGVARMDLFQRWYKKVEWYSVAHDVMFVDLPALKSTPGFFDGESVVEAEYGVPLRCLWAISAIAGLTSTAGEPRRVEALLSTVDDKLATAWRGLYEIGLDELRERAAADLKVASAWSFSAFYDRPIALFGEAGAAIAPTYLMEKATLNGTMWTVRSLLDDDCGLTFTSAVGAAFQRYAERLVREAVGDPTRVTSEKELRTRWGKGPLFDLRIEYPDAWVALEFVRRNPTKETQTSGDFVAFLRDLDKAFIEKVEQIDGCLARGAKIRWPSR